MLDEILHSLERHPSVDDWVVQHRRSRSVQLYLIGNSVESRRSVTTEAFVADVYNDHPRPAPAASAAFGAADVGAAPAPEAARGSSSVQLVPGDRHRIGTRIDEAVQMARLVHNSPYQLAKASAYPDVPLADPVLTSSGDMSAVAAQFADELWTLVGREPGVRLSAAELFLTLTDVELRNSRGARGATQGSRVLLELVLLAGERGPGEAESFRQIEARRMQDLVLPETVGRAATAARDGLRATTPRTRTGPVVLEGDALTPLFEAFTFHASAASAYAKLARFQPGECVFGEHEVRGDRLTLRSNALRPFGLRSHRFDGDGVPGQDVLLIEQGVLRARHATQRYAEYLGIPATGEEGNTEVAPGTAPLSGLLQPEAGGDSVYHVTALSAPEVDPVTGDFGSEIRLGYEVGGGSVRPIKGGSVSGNVFDAFADAHFSREMLDRQGYAGPRAVRFATLTVAGEG